MCNEVALRRKASEVKLTVSEDVDESALARFLIDVDSEGYIVPPEDVLAQSIQQFGFMTFCALRKGNKTASKIFYYGRKLI